jgi:hypothetical protein
MSDLMYRLKCINEELDELFGIMPRKIETLDDIFLQEEILERMTELEGMKQNIVSFCN